MTLAASVTGCSEDDSGFDCTKLPVCDIGQAECQDRVFRATACAREQRARRRPAVARRDVGKHVGARAPHAARDAVTG
jgi:hypothetical protein